MVSRKRMDGRRRWYAATMTSLLIGKIAVGDEPGQYSVYKEDLTPPIWMFSSEAIHGLLFPFLA